MFYGLRFQVTYWTHSGNKGVKRLQFPSTAVVQVREHSTTRLRNAKACGCGSTRHVRGLQGKKEKKKTTLSRSLFLFVYPEYCRSGCAFSFAERVHIIPVQPPHLSPPVCALRNLSFLSSSSFLISARVFPAIAETLNIQTPEVKDSSEIFKREL